METQSDLLSISSFEEEYDIQSSDDFFRWAHINREWIKIYIKFGTKQSVMNAILRADRNRFLSWKSVINNFISYSGLGYLTERFFICPGHMAYTNWNDLSDSPNHLSQHLCEVCLSPSPLGSYFGENSFTYIPIRPRLQSMVLNEQTCKELFSYNIIGNAGIINDFFDGRSFDRIKNQYGGYESIKNDIFLAVSTDGFQPFYNSNEQVWPFLALILNLSPTYRYKVANILPLAFAPGPSPTNLQSFLAPLMHEIRDEFGDEGSP